MKRRKPSHRRSSRALRAVLVLLLLCVLGAFGWCRWVDRQIENYAERDEAAPAEYDGRPSPVYRARLDHALTLYRHGVAPLLITLGGNGGDQYNEGAVGKEYLMAMGVPESAIIAETESRNTEESARRVSVIARANGLRRLVIVSDGTHLFRIHAICAADGLNVLTSPRPRVPVEDEARADVSQFERVAHEVLSYTAWRMHLH